jgi:hypothetical protein
LHYLAEVGLLAGREAAEGPGAVDTAFARGAGLAVGAAVVVDLAGLAGTLIAVLSGLASAAAIVAALVRNTAVVCTTTVVSATAIVAHSSVVTDDIVRSGIAVLTDLLDGFILLGIAAILDANITIGARFVWAAIDSGIAGSISAGQQGQQQDEGRNSH